MKKRWLLSAGLLLLLLTPLLLLILPGSWFIGRIENIASTQLGMEVRIGGLELDLLSSTPAAAFSEVSIDDDSGSPLISVGKASVAIDAVKLIDREVVFNRIDVEKATIQLGTDADGKNNWQDLIPAVDHSEASSKEASTSLPAIAALDLNDITIDYQNAQRDLSASLLVNASGSTLAEAVDTEVTGVGEFNGQAVEFKLQTDPLQALTSDEQAVDIDVQLSLGDTRLAASGSIGDLAGFRDLKLMLSLEAPALDDLAQLLDVPLPVIPPYRIAGSLKRDGDDFILDKFNGELGDSDIEGDLRLDMTTSPVTLYANAISRVLDLDDLAGIVGAQVGRRRDAGCR